MAIDAGSNQISVLRVRGDGSLRLVRHGVESSGGLLPDSIAVHSDLVYVANSGTGEHPDPDRAAPGQVLFSGPDERARQLSPELTAQAGGRDFRAVPGCDTP